MKKGFLIILSICLIVLPGLGQNDALIIYKSNNSVQSIALNNLDSVQIDKDMGRIHVHLSDGNVLSVNISQIDSLVYAEVNSDLPAIQLLTADYEYKLDRIVCELEITNNGGCDILDRGLCWSRTNQNPTLNDNKFSSGYSKGKFYASTTGLVLGNSYYVRPYVTNCMGTSYGEAKKIETLMGNVTYTLDVSKTQYPEYHKLLTTALDSACYYYNRYTEFEANIYVYYNAGIPTAQANYHGSIGFGPNTGYMWVGTTMHEMAHFFGSGTTNTWKSLMVNGIWQGEKGQNMCQQLLGEQLRGDNSTSAVHYWPTGINYRSEVSSETDLINHAKVIQAMLIEDCGLPASW